MKKSLFLFFSLLLLFNSPHSAFAQAGASHVHAKIIIDHESLQPSENPDNAAARIGLLLDIESGWHTYWRNSGEAAIPTKVTWQLPEGWKAGELQWPAPTRFAEKGSITTYGYRDQTLLWTWVYTPEVIPQDGQKVTIGAKISFLVCKEICVPGQQTAQIEIPFSTSLSLQPSKDFSLFESYAATSPKSWEALKQLPNFSQAKFEPALGTLPEGGLVASIAMHGLKAADTSTLTEQVQVFPYTSAGFLADKPSGKVTDDGFLLRLPLKKNGTASATDIGGIVVVSSAMAGLPTDTSFEWKIPVSSANADLAPEVRSGDGFLPLTFRIKGTSETPAAASSAPKKEESSGTLLGALLAAFFAGMLLNLMPCVLPIISIKIMGFVSQAKQSRRTIILSSLTFAAGILTSFLVLAIILISLRSVGFSMGWGFQFQYPEFVAALLLIVFFLSLALFDFYTVNLPFMQNANDAASKVHSPYLRHFFDGVLATSLSTPCTAPILGTALVFAFAQPPIFTVLIFLTIGAGLAVPYVILSSNPALINRLPQPGNWMYHFRQTMGFLLLGTCAWLLSVMHDLTDRGDVWTVVLLLLLFFFLWMRRTVLENNPERGRAPWFNILFFTALIGSGWWLYPSIVIKRGEAAKGLLIPWTPFSASTLEEAAKNKREVFLDFTASWCLTCKFNEFRIIETSATAAALKKNNVLAVKADWTGGDEEITAALKGYGAEGVPLYVILPANGGEPIVLSTLPAQSTLLDAIQKGAS